MARETKPGIQYFSHDVDMLQDKRIKIIKAKHGLIGYAAYLRLLEEVYRENGYYLHIDEDFNILFSDDNNLDYNVYILILNDCIEKGLFNKEMYEKFSILTSKRIQQNYFDATERRKSVTIIENYMVLQPSEKYVQKVDVNIETLNVNIEAEKVDIGTQSKVKESKVKKNKIKEDKTKKEPKKKTEDHVAVLDYYKYICERFPQPRSITDKRKSHIKARIEEYGLKIIFDALETINESKFLNENIGSTWLNFDWFWNVNNFAKVVEGNYNKKAMNIVKHDQRPKNKFHDFDQRSNKYSADELEAKLLKKSMNRVTVVERVGE